MRDLILTLVQADQVWEDKAANLQHYEALLATAETGGLILLPEMFHTGFTMNGEVLAESMDDSLAVNWLQKTAIAKNSALYTSFVARENDRLYNRGLFVFPDGSFRIYDKRKTFGLAGEDRVYAAGTSETIVDYLGWKINLQICYDLRFPENVRNGLLEDGTARYDLLVYVANWPERRSEHWKALLKARAIENQCYVAAVNRVGTDANQLAYSGDSMIINALGEIVLDMPQTEGLRKTPLSLGNLREIRNRLPFLSDSDYRLFNR